jgi:two-component system, sensor histidine kinase and response regulator
MLSKKPKILIVDDTAENINVLIRVFERTDYQISFAPNGKKALELISMEMPDLILLDIMMPEMDGFEVCKTIKANPETREIPIIFITAKDETEDIIKGFSMGAVDYIVKPFRAEEVCTRVQTQIKNQAFQRELILKNIRLMEMDKEVRDKNQRLESLNELKDKFIGIAAHDLRNPLSSIKGFSEMLQEDDLSAEDRKEFVDMIYSISENMFALLNDLLDINLIESGKLNLVLQNSNLGELTKKQISINRTIANKKNIKIKFIDLGCVDSEFDYDRISQVLNNFLNNAIKFSPRETTLRVKLSHLNDFNKVEVIDEGPGILQEEQKKLFGEFQKLSPRPTAGETSTGLGLAIAKKIIIAHKGFIGVKSETGHGSNFFFTLPI